LMHRYDDGSEFSRFGKGVVGTAYAGKRPPMLFKILPDLSESNRAGHDGSIA
jgi:hypothetical protein